MRFLLNIFLIAVITLVPCASSTRAQTPQPVGTISGQVIDNSGNGIANATVILVGDQTGTQIAHTNASGHYAISYYPNNHRIAVTPFKSSYLFNPASVAFVSNIFLTGDRNLSFTGTLFPFLFALPVLLTEDNSSQALALDSVTLMRGPFPIIAPHNFSPNQRTRIILFAAGAELMQGESLSNVTARAEASNGTYSLPVESVRKVAGYDWLSQVVIRLPDELSSATEAWVTITVRGLASNRVLVKVKP